MGGEDRSPSSFPPTLHCDSLNSLLVLALQQPVDLPGTLGPPAAPPRQGASETVPAAARVPRTRASAMRYQPKGARPRRSRKATSQRTASAAETAATAKPIATGPTPSASKIVWPSPRDAASRFFASLKA